VNESPFLSVPSKVALRPISQMSPRHAAPDNQQFTGRRKRQRLKSVILYRAATAVRETFPDLIIPRQLLRSDHCPFRIHKPIPAAKFGSM